MSNSSYMPTNDGGKAELLEHLAVTLPKYAELLEISTADLENLKKKSASFRYALNTLYALQSYTQHYTEFKNSLRDGGSGNADWPLPPKFDENIPPAVECGVIPWVSALAARIKAHRNYTAAIGQDCWLIAATHVFDPGALKPALSFKNNVGHPVIVWTKGKASGIEIWVDRGDSNGFVFLTINTEPNTTDNAPLPASGSTAIWKYKAIYRLHDEQVGQWSDVISVMVGG